jgi:hypothetical protein
MSTTTQTTVAEVIGMGAITICQPYADLILLPDDHPEHKRAENRTWPCRYTGPLLIHAGKSRDWLDEDDDNPGYDLHGLKIADMQFGAIVGVVEMVACFSLNQIRMGGVPQSFRWLNSHQHVQGPYCHVYRNPRRFASPIPCRGALGIFKVTEAHLAAPAPKAKPAPTAAPSLFPETQRHQ